MEKFLRTVSLTLAVTFCVSGAFAQKAKALPRRPAPPAIFAVINDGSTIEPIELIENGKPVDDSDSMANDDLDKNYYKTGTKYNLIFGGAPSGTVTIRRSNVGTDCGGSSADVSVQSGKAKLKGFVMGLATNVPLKNAKEPGLRRMPTAAERTEIDALVRAEYAKNKVPTPALKMLHYYNLTAVDVDNDGTPEFIGTYWIAPNRNRRDILFFIAEKHGAGQYQLAHSDYSALTSKDLMSGDLRDLDTMGGELLLDLLDYNADGVSEIFTIQKAFEGNNYHAYVRNGKKWTKVLDGYDYRCAY